MWLHLVLASLLALGSKAFVAAPIQRAVLPARTSIQWAGLPARRFILTPMDLDSEVKPQTLTIRAHFGSTSPAEIPTFIAQPDKTITLADAGLCIEASGARSGDVVRLNRCTGSPAQLWITSRGSKGRIQLEGSEKCINVDAAEGDLNGALVDLQECEDKTAQSWMLEEHIPLPTQNPAEYPAPSMRPEYPAPSMRHVAIALISVVALTALSFSIWWRRWHKAPTDAMSQGGSTLNVDHGGVCVAKPLPVRNDSLTLAVMALSPGLEPGHAVKELDGSTDLESPKKLTLNDLKGLLRLLGMTFSGTKAELIRRLEAALTPTPASTQDERFEVELDAKLVNPFKLDASPEDLRSMLKAIGLKANGGKMKLTRRLEAATLSHVMVISPTPDYSGVRTPVNSSSSQCSFLGDDDIDGDEDPWDDLEVAVVDDDRGASAVDSDPSNLRKLSSYEQETCKIWLSAKELEKLAEKAGAYRALGAFSDHGLSDSLHGSNLEAGRNDNVAFEEIVNELFVDKETELLQIDEATELTRSAEVQIDGQPLTAPELNAELNSLGLSVGGKMLSARQAKKKKDKKKQKQLKRWRGQDWSGYHGCFTFIVDCEPLADIVNGYTRPQCPEAENTIDRTAANLQSILDSGWCPNSDPVRWAPRRHNVVADYLCNYAMDYKQNLTETFSIDLPQQFNILIHSDGGERPDCSSAAWVVELVSWQHDVGGVGAAPSDHVDSGIAVAQKEHDVGEWKVQTLAYSASYIDSGISSFTAEALALYQVTNFIDNFIHRISTSGVVGKRIV